MSSQPNLFGYESSDLLQSDAFEGLSLQEWPEQLIATDDTAKLRLVAVDGERVAVRSPQYRLGSPDLPIAPYRDHITQTIAENQSVVIKSETGSGKSSQLGLYLLEEGYPRVFIAQPRIIAARKLMEWARENLSPEYRHLAGRLTGMESDSDCGPDARLIYITEQLLFKMANRNQLRPDDVIINDEAHERSVPNMHLLWLLKHDLLPNNPQMRQVITSATIDPARFADYAADGRNGRAVPILSLPGRTHPITHVETDMTVAEAIASYATDGHNVLAFEPGVSRMQATESKVSRRLPGAEKIHLLYGDQSPATQAKALNPADHNHVIATRVGETSITPENKTVVVDGGLSNVAGYEAGVRVLETVFSSRDTMTQRSGRVGRMAPGIGVRAVPEDAPPPPAFADREEFEPSPIQNSSVASYILELQSRGRRHIPDEFMEAPTDENLRHDYRLLRRLGAISLQAGELTVTDIGRQMTDIPLNVSMARMLVEARRLQVAEGQEAERDLLRLQVAAIGAIYQTNGILDTRQSSGMRFLRKRSHQEKFSNEQSSDPLFQLDTFVFLRTKQQALLAGGLPDADAKFERFLESSDILPNRYIKAVRIFDELCRREGLDPAGLQVPTRVQRKQIIACQIAGAEELFVQRSKLMHRDIRDQTRSLGRYSTVTAGLAELVVGVPFDFRGMRSSGVFGRRFITGGSIVSVKQILESAPGRVTTQGRGHGVDRNGAFVEKQALYFDGTLFFGEVENNPSPTLETRRALITAMMTGSAPSAENPNHIVEFTAGTDKAARAVRVYSEALALDHRSRASLHVTERYQKLIERVVHDSVELVPLEVTDPAGLDGLIPQVYKSSLVQPARRKDIPDIIRNSPDALVLHADDDKKRYIPITYRNGIAYVTVPRDLKYRVSEKDLAELREHHDIKLRVATGEYQLFDAFFKRVDEQRNSPRRQERIRRREEIAAANTTDPATRALQDTRQPIRRQKKDPRDAALHQKAKSVEGILAVQRRKSTRRKEQSE